MAGEKHPKFRLPELKGSALWLPVVALLGLGLITSAVDLFALPGNEAERALLASQRFTVDAATGNIAIGKNAAHGEDSATFDVEEPAAEAVEKTEAPPAEATPDVATPEETAHPEPTEPAATSGTATEAPTETPAAEHSSEATPDVATPQETEAATPAPAQEAATETPLPEGTPSLRTEPIAADLNAPTRTKDSLVSAPAPEVTELVDGVQLPKRGDKDVVPSKLYAHPFKRMPEQVLISFVVMDAGLDPQSIGLMMGLPKQVTIAYSPYSRKNANYSEHLRATGHEMWTMLPTMGDNYPADDPGPMGLIGRMPAEELVRRTQLVLGSIAGSVGLILPPNETIALQKDSLSPTLGELAKRGMLLLSTHPSRNLDQITNNKGLAEIIRRADLILDPEPSEAQIRSRLAGMLDAAKEKGEYVVMLSARPQTLQILIDWLHSNPIAEPFVLAPLTAIYQPKEKPEAATEEAVGGHGAPKEKKKEKPSEKKKKPLPQDKYLKPAGGGDGGHGGGGEKSGGGH
jgi:polysaccharide deacetylase 2 family uncharacterized protein YibQ